MSDHAFKNGILGGPPRQQAKGDTNRRDLLVFGHDAERCKTTGRFFEVGSGALSREEQTAMFLRDATIADDMPREGEFCLQTGRRYEIGSGALPKTIQSERFLAELPPAAQAERQANANALLAIEPAGRA